MMPEAPVRFSTMNCCFSDSESFAAKSRASGSTDPPGGYGETNFTMRVGHSCAVAGTAAARAAMAQAILVMRSKRDIPSSLQLEHLTRVLRRRDYEAELLQDAPRLRYLR